MKIKSDYFRIAATATDLTGQKLEPEDQPVQRVLETSFQASGTNGQVFGQVGGEIAAQSTAGVVASRLRAMCAGCKHFDNRDWIKLVRRSDDPLAPRDQRELVNSMRASLLMTFNATLDAALTDTSPAEDGGVDVEHVLMSMGMCHALTSHYGDQVGVHPLSSCPEEVCGPNQPAGFFQHRTNESERASDKGYDIVMQRAAGKIL
jgi:hypothetical protein